MCAYINVCSCKFKDIHFNKLLESKGGFDQTCMEPTVHVANAVLPFLLKVMGIEG